MATTSTIPPKKASAIPTAPGALPVLGHALQLLRDPLDFVCGLARYGELVRVRLGNHPVVVVCDPELTRRLLLDDRTFDKVGPIYQRSRDVVGTGLAGCPHSGHRRQRRLCQPSFHPHRIPEYAPHFTAAAEHRMASWQDGQVIDVSGELMTMTMRSSVAAMFAAEIPHRVERLLLADLTTLLNGSFRQIISPTVLNRLPTRANRRYQLATERFGRTLREIIDHRRTDRTGPSDLLASLLGAVAPEDPDGRPVLTDQEISDQLRTFFVAGTETTAATLGWALHLLSRHPRVQSTLQAEADAVLGGSPPTAADLPALRTTANVVTETLRIYPPAWMLTRETTRPVVLGGHAFPTASTVAWSPYLLHHRADFYPEPERFDPQRWSDRKPDRTTFIPFGGGPRKCIGDQFALTQATLALAALAARWRFTPVAGPPVKPVAKSTLTPRGLRLRVNRR
ncbi:cytochrome P450 [Kitasatospora sp. RB6PN24]|uniref:cytochrome P450 n=1 Tax=Kitasatospora humi TaxID=2893891 RepID=UPI001E36711B|nr:cytochrome P450 [Kitasatospora humi]MCC9306238.1 cytochrome P450 [Kitasatospora humi]